MSEQEQSEIFRRMIISFLRDELIDDHVYGQIADRIIHGQAVTLEVLVEKLQYAPNPVVVIGAANIR